MSNSRLVHFLAYVRAVGTGKLTKVTSPSGDTPHLALSYASGLLTKVELKKGSTVLDSTTYA